MKPYISPRAQQFLTPAANEEAVDQPLYHLQSYGTAGATLFTFFNTAQTGNFGITNMDNQSILPKGKRFMVFGIGVAFLGGQAPVQNGTSTTLASYLNDARSVIEGSGWIDLTILDKSYLKESPLSRCPAGIGLFTGAGGIQATQASAADGLRQVSYGSNGVPALGNVRWLSVPIPIPEQVRFSVTANFNTAVTVGTAGTLGVWLLGRMIRVVQ